MKKGLRLWIAASMCFGSVVCVNSALPTGNYIGETKNDTKKDVIAAFKAREGSSGYEIIDFILVEDEQLPKLKAVISYYDKENDNDCNLAFLYGDIIQRLCFAVNEVAGVKSYEIADNSKLRYRGDGAVTTAIRNIDTKEVIDYTITFSYDEPTLTTEFKVEAEKR
ncbi:hypothetical protein BEP19_08730 [Ammoniphilus oxalaticus]|uniref:DUF5067 domain-containing protein n=1 Tax=Ammoniphilus oxalaticus TaxID=66863 RepID=A0A419SKG1_9BACL|nr:hypothetical protein [Ammoniphilus oxalaticus]RKD24462.1 hypothetical protein BEP19_08730 [Ammoniphilus oxalaticus]